MEVSKVDKGLECGIALDGFPNNFTLEIGDIIEGYKIVEAEPDKFDMSAGLKLSY